MENYARLIIYYDSLTHSVKNMGASTIENSQNYSDPAIEGIVNFWQQKTDEALSEKIGYASGNIGRYSNGMHNMFVDSWLHSFPLANISMSNEGGIRQDIPAGDITLATIVGLLPFQNNIIELSLKGSEMMSCVENDIILGGITSIPDYKFLDGTPIDREAIYTVLTIDYLYSRSDYSFSSFDGNPYNTSVHYRQPLIDWIKSLNTSVSDPLHNYLDNVRRR